MSEGRAAAAAAGVGAGRPPRGARLLEAVGAASPGVLMGAGAVDVGGRNLLNRPLPWGTEVLEMVLALMIFTLYPVLALGFGHITVDLISVRPALQRVQRVLGAGFGIVLFTILCACLVRQATRAAGYGETTALLNLPTAWIFAVMALLSGFTALAFVVAAVRAARRPPPQPRVAETL